MQLKFLIALLPLAMTATANPIARQDGCLDCFPPPLPSCLFNVFGLGGCICDLIGGPDGLATCLTANCRPGLGLGGVIASIIGDCPASA